MKDILANINIIFCCYIAFIIFITFYLLRIKRTVILIIIIFCINLLILFSIDNFNFSVEKLLFHIYQALCMFFGALDYQSIILDAKNISIYDHLQLIIPFQFVISILYSITFTISYFSLLLDRKIYFFLRKNIYIFSHLNHHSIILAKDIAKQKKNNIIFCNIDHHSQYYKTYLEDLEQINALLINKSISDISIKKNASVFLISDNDITNIHLLEEISQRLNKKNHFINKFFNSKENELTIYPFIKQRNHEIYADNTVELQTPIKVINEVDLIINDILLKQPPLPTRKDIKIIIIGAGKIGTRFLKALYWYCTFPDVKVTITIVTPHCTQTIHELSCDCPEIFNNKTKKIGRKTFIIRNSKKIIFKEYDVRNRDFINYIDNTDFDYYFVALGDDNLNAQTSIKIRQSLAQHYFSKETCFSKPIITIIMDQNLNNIVSKMKIFVDKKNPEAVFYNYKIDCYGRYDDIYSYNKIINNPLIKAGTKVFANREKSAKTSKNDAHKNKINDFQCNHRSNIAFILHIQCKLHILAKNQYQLAIINDKNEEKVSFETLLEEKPCTILPQIEHERWRCFYETEGFQYVDDTTIIKYRNDFGLKNYLAKLHPALCNQKELSKRKNRFKTKYIVNDENLISNIDQIIKDELCIKKITKEEQSNE